MKTFKKQRLGVRGFVLNHHIKGGDVVIVPMHAPDCKRVPYCSCGAVEAMPKNVVNCDIEWPVRKSSIFPL